MSFLKVAKIVELEGKDWIVVSLPGRKVGVFRRSDGTLEAMEVTCKHQRADLTQGRWTGDVVTCPRHGWRYDMSTGECLTESWAGLRFHDLEVDGEWIRVSAEPRAETSAADFPDLGDWV